MSEVTVSSLNHTMPHRLTVASVAYFRFSTSNMMRTFEGRLRRSPLGKVSNLLSSRTLFRFSTHSGSTSPSNMIQCLFDCSPRRLSTIFRSILVNKPSVHSRVVLSRLPYRLSLDMTLGSMTWQTPSTPSVCCRALNRTFHIADLPEPESPTIITPWWIL